MPNRLEMLKSVLVQDPNNVRLAMVWPLRLECR